MEALIFCGIQATGKSSFYKSHFFNSHVRISLDLLHTRHKEARFMELCADLQQRVVIDNTNPSRLERARYLSFFKEAGYAVQGYYFQSKLQDCLTRNALRSGKDHIDPRGIRGTYARLEIPAWSEGFDQLFFVRTQPDFSFHVETFQPDAI